MARKMHFGFLIVLVFVATIAGLQFWRWADQAFAARVWRDLSDKVAEPSRFDPSMVSHLPEPARRYFRYTIRTGSPILTVAVIRMSGELGLGTKDRPNYGPMHAEQILAPPYGLVWNLTADRGLMTISGSDGYDGDTSWVRFWLSNVVPIVRAGGNSDHARAAFGRVVAEAVFWAPASLLPQFGVSWEAVDSNTARATVRGNGMTQTVDVVLAEDGHPTKVVIPRWTDANDEKVFRLQPFGGYLSEFRDFGGYTLPTRVEGGNWIGTDNYFPFYKAVVEELHFLGGRK